MLRKLLAQQSQNMEQKITQQEMPPEQPSQTTSSSSATISQTSNDLPKSQPIDIPKKKKKEDVQDDFFHVGNPMDRFRNPDYKELFLNVPEWRRRYNFVVAKAVPSHNPINTQEMLSPGEEIFKMSP